MKLKKTRFGDCKLRECDFTGCALPGAVFEGCDLTRSDFDRADLSGADLTTAFGYSIDPASTTISKAKFSLSGLPGLVDRYNLEIDYSH